MMSLALDYKMPLQFIGMAGMLGVRGWGIVSWLRRLRGPKVDPYRAVSCGDSDAFCPCCYFVGFFLVRLGLDCGYRGTNHVLWGKQSLYKSSSAAKSLVSLALVVDVIGAA